MLCVLCVGSCFALYSVNATNVSVNISATYQSSWTVDTQAYYLVILSDSDPTAWGSVTITESNSVLLNDATTDGNQAQKSGITIQSGTKLRILKGDGTVYPFWQEAISGYIHNYDETIYVDGTASYNIFLNSNYKGYMSVNY